MRYLWRLVSLFIDAMMLGLFMFPLAILISSLGVEDSLRLEFFIVGFLLFFLKDLFSKNGSLGKVITGQVIVFSGTSVKKKINFRKVIRNITLLIWPLEGVVLLICKGRRIGDFLVKSEVVWKKMN